MTRPITQEQDLLFQSYFTVSLLIELKNNKLFDSEYYDRMQFGAPWIKNELQKIGIDNQGCALMVLYAMLVMPREIIQEAYSSKYDEINTFLETHTQNTKTTYTSDSSSTNYLRHIRNAVAHARVAFRPTDVIIFYDENKRSNETFSTELPLVHLEEMVNQLQMVHLAYIKDLQQQT